MAINVLWRGTASVTAQIDTVTLSTATWAGDGNITTTMTAEDGTTTQTVVTATVNDSQTVNRDAHLTALQASGQSMFAALTWATSGSASFTATAKVAGVPFYQATTEDDSVGTISSDSTTTPNSGPHDWGTDANWSDEAGTASAKPAAGDFIILSDSDVSILYGLNQSALSAMGSVDITETFTGLLGQPKAGYYLHLDCPTWRITSRSPTLLIKPKTGSNSKVVVTGGQGSADALRLDGDVDNLLVNPGFSGVVTIKDSMTLDNVYSTSAGADVQIGKSVSSLDNVLIASGKCTGQSACTNLIVGASAQVEWKQGSITGTGGLFAANPGVINQGGILKYKALSTIGLLTNIGGTTELGSPVQPSTFTTATSNVLATTTVADASIRGGRVIEKGLVTMTTNAVIEGGQYIPYTQRKVLPSNV